MEDNSHSHSIFIEQFSRVSRARILCRETHRRIAVRRLCPSGVVPSTVRLWRIIDRCSRQLDQPQSVRYHPSFERVWRVHGHQSVAGKHRQNLAAKCQNYETIGQRCFTPIHAWYIEKGQPFLIDMDCLFIEHESSPVLNYKINTVYWAEYIHYYTFWFLFNNFRSWDIICGHEEATLNPFAAFDDTTRRSNEKSYKNNMEIIQTRNNMGY